MLPGKQHHPEIIVELQNESGTCSNQALPAQSGYNAGGKECADEPDKKNHVQDARLKARILAQPSWPWMLKAHINCFGIGILDDQMIDEILCQYRNVIDKYSVFCLEEGEDFNDKNLDKLMVNYYYPDCCPKESNL